MKLHFFLVFVKYLQIFSDNFCNLYSFCTKQSDYCFIQKTNLFKMKNDFSNNSNFAKNIDGIKKISSGNVGNVELSIMFF